jgi:hypothetical protein
VRAAASFLLLTASLRPDPSWLVHRAVRDAPPGENDLTIRNFRWNIGQRVIVFKREVRLCLDY